MEIKNLKTFLAVARLLSFNKAAEALHYAQSTVSAQIQGLEDELGVRLFDRLGRGILLTEAGHRLRHYAGKLVALEEAAQAEIKEPGKVMGSLTIRVPETVLTYRLPKVVRLFKDRFPRVSLRFISCAVEGLAKDLRQGVIDMAFVLTDSAGEADLYSEVVGYEDLCLAAGTEHPLAGKGRLELSDLAGQTILLSRVDCAYRRMLERMLREAGVSLGEVLEFNSVAGIKECVSQGLGITVLPRISASQAADEGKLVELPMADGAWEAANLMAWHKDKWISPSLAGFIETTREVLVAH